MPNRIRLEIKAQNIGPHTNLDETLETGSLQLGIYANNGSGKTFLSRIFRFISKKSHVNSDTNKLLTLNQNRGSFEFNVVDIASGKNSLVSSFKVLLNRNCEPTIVQDGKYIFHVFNDDYAKENLEVFRYKPNGDIEGYILGKEQIDLSKEKADLAELLLNIEKKDNLVLNAILVAKSDLDKLGIRNNIKEFSYINYDNIIRRNEECFECDLFDVLSEKLTKIKSFPENLVDLQCNQLEINVNILREIQSYLEFQFQRSNVLEEFKTKYLLKQSFIEKGLSLLGEGKDNCPFCEQLLGLEAIDLLNNYNDYLNNAESKEISRGDEMIIYLSNIESSIQAMHSEFDILKLKYKEYQSHLFSKTEELKDLESSVNLLSHIESLRKLVVLKQNDISKCYSNDVYNIHIDNIINSITEYVMIISTNKSFLVNINKIKDNVQNEILELKRQIIKSKVNELKTTLKQVSLDITDNNAKILALEEDIKFKEESEKIEKKKKIAEFFIHYLGVFFRNKYTFDADTFCIKFQNSLLTENASDVLSEREKNIVSFCYYLSEIHKIVETQSDYERLFLVIDDPISSLDFHYVYSVSQIIRNFGRTFGLNRVRFLVLTHNMEFMSILVRNKIINHKYVLSHNSIKSLRKEMVMPYEEHLRDIYHVSTGSQYPTHTTPNSIRHVLETINRFMAPDLELQTFCNSIECFDECEFLYALIQDNSHGSIRSQKAYTDDLIKQGCEVVIYYLGMNLKGQLNNIT